MNVTDANDARPLQKQSGRNVTPSGTLTDVRNAQLPMELGRICSEGAALQFDAAVKPHTPITATDGDLLQLRTFAEDVHAEAVATDDPQLG